MVMLADIWAFLESIEWSDPTIVAALIGGVVVLIVGLGGGFKWIAGLFGG